VSIEQLRQILADHAVPDPRIVGKLPRSGIQLDYVGHAEITKILIEIDPMWTLEPVAFDDDGLPAVRRNGKMIEAAFWMTILGHRRYCIGSVEARKGDGDLGKELISDALRNGAMRFGVALSLWSKEEWQTDDLMPADKKPKPKPKVVPVDPATTVDPKLLDKFEEACLAKGINPDQLADKAGVNLNNVTLGDMDLLRAAFKEMQ